MSDAINSFGTAFKSGDGGSPTETFASVAEILDLEGPDMQLNTEDVTNHGSEDGWEEHAGTTLAAGEVTFDLNFIFDDPSHDMSTGLQADMVNRTVRNRQIVYPDGNGYQFAGLVTGWKPKAPVKGVLRASVKVKITGPVTAI